MPSSVYDRILEVIRTIPRGEVMTYGQVAAAAGLPRGARVVGYALRSVKGKVPWHRVVGQARKGWGKISIKDPVAAARQRRLLRGERVRFTREGEIRLTAP